MTDPNEPDSGPGCLTSLVLVLGSALLIAMALINEMRLQSIETKLGMPHCGIFNATAWDGHTCHEAKK